MLQGYHQPGKRSVISLGISGNSEIIELLETPGKIGGLSTAVLVAHDAQALVSFKGYQTFCTEIILNLLLYSLFYSLKHKKQCEIGISGTAVSQQIC